MHKDYMYALLLAIFGLGIELGLMALHPYLEFIYLPNLVPPCVWKTCLRVGIFISAICLLIAILIIFWPSKARSMLNAIGIGGRGGNARVVGRNSMAEGGVGGQGGVGTGGAGGDAEVLGDNSYARGGDGGNSGQLDGRGGRRTMSPGERLNLPTSTWAFGHGGAGANAPEYNRRLKLLTEIRTEYIQMFPGDGVFINAGVDQVPARWVNKRLEEQGEPWEIEMKDGGYKMPPLNKA